MSTRGVPRIRPPQIEPIKQNLDWAIRDWLLPRAKAGDLVVFYFAGQAAAAVKAQGPKVESRVDYYLLPIDASPDTLEQKGFSLDKAVQQCVGKRLQVVCWLATSLARPGWKSPAGSQTGRSRQVETEREELARRSDALARGDGLAGVRRLSRQRRAPVPTSSSRTRCSVRSVSPVARGTWRPASTTSRETRNSGFVGFGRSAVCRPS